MPKVIHQTGLRIPVKLPQRTYQSVVAMFYEIEFTPCCFQYAPPCLELKR